MRYPTLIHGSLAAAATAAVLGCSQARPAEPRPLPGEPLPPYTVRVGEIEEGDAQRLAKALGAIDGVDEVEVDTESGAATVQMEKGLFLYEPHVDEALADAELELAGFEAPAEALVTVYEVVASGGG